MQNSTPFPRVGWESWIRNELKLGFLLFPATPLLCWRRLWTQSRRFQLHWQLCFDGLDFSHAKTRFIGWLVSEQIETNDVKGKKTAEETDDKPRMKLTYILLQSRTGGKTSTITVYQNIFSWNFPLFSRQVFAGETLVSVWKERERENSNSNSKTLFSKDCSLSSFRPV